MAWHGRQAGRGKDSHRHSSAEVHGRHRPAAAGARLPPPTASSTCRMCAQFPFRPFAVVCTDLARLEAVAMAV